MIVCVLANRNCFSGSLADLVFWVCELANGVWFCFTAFTKLAARVISNRAPSPPSVFEMHAGMNSLQVDCDDKWRCREQKFMSQLHTSIVISLKTHRKSERLDICCCSSTGLNECLLAP